ncbi:hypothetical protein ACFX13_028217 [Malus domestica]
MLVVDGYPLVDLALSTWISLFRHVDLTVLFDKARNPSTKSPSFAHPLLGISVVDSVHQLIGVRVTKLEELNGVAAIVGRLGKRCAEPALQGFEHVYADFINGVIHVKELGFLVKDMESMVRKMERYVSTTSNLYSEMEVLNELEQATNKFQNNQHEEMNFRTSGRSSRHF